ncbi:amidase [Candidatus Bathyarchaeota archaeon]|nr:amidase [Candidatus Bathyarchaeota archaeon]MBT4319635.1 amidase [Candidatus Bathyarchaeota archaeon]MBT6604614.1 amidase [Candidatus Bathyarchaeota archaeon]MBT7187337.1 amidase [Candidatus Bathyarchaeota archaeon]
MKPYELSLAEASSRIKNGSLSPIDLAESLLERIDEIEPTLEAWVTVNGDQVRKEAEKITRMLGEGVRSGIHGIPVGVKDIYFTKGMKTTMGSPIFRNYVPGVDADILVTMKQAGGIVLGKTETTEFAVHDPAPTRNPWNTGHTPGGSSSGSSAAVASGMCQVAFGSQTGGSVIRPASYCGIVGVKPTYDLFSRGSIFPLSWSLDHVGYMTRTTQDAHIMLEALTGKEKEWHPRIHAPKVGLLAGYFKENAVEEVWQGFERSVAKIWGEGADVEMAMLPESFKLVPDVHKVIMSVETAAVHEDIFKTRGDEYRSYLRGFISSGLLVPATAYLRAQRLRGQIIQDMRNLIGQFDCVICPSATDSAPEGLEWTGSPAFNSPWSLTGFPSITVPSSLTENGLPLGLQIIGIPYSEWELLEIAAWCEDKLGFGTRPIDPRGS